MKILAVGGEPATGKTTLFRHLIKELGKGKLQKNGLLVYQTHELKKCIVLGSYADKGFGGTDKLSMAVQPIALGVLESWASSPKMSDWTVLFEGDRLFNSSFLASLSDLDKTGKIDYYCVMLEASPEIQDQRHKDRNDTQSETWLKGRKTKVKKLKDSLENLKILKNETKEDLKSNVETLLKMIES